MIEWYYYIFIREANMDQTPFKKIIKISSFFFLALVTYLIYYPTISPEPAKREGISKNHSRTESEDRYRIGVSQVNDFQIRILTKGRLFMTKKTRNIFIRLIFTKRTKGFSH